MYGLVALDKINVLRISSAGGYKQWDGLLFRLTEAAMDPRRGRIDLTSVSIVYGFQMNTLPTAMLFDEGKFLSASQIDR